MSRRDQLLAEAARLFAARGFHGASIEDLGAAVGISGPGVYKHFPSKDAVLGEMLVGISRRLLDGGRREVEQAADDDDALERLVAAQTAFALTEPELIRVQDRDLANLSAERAREVRRLQRAYVEVWVGVLTRLRPDLPLPDARTAAHAAFGLLNSTPYSASPRREVLQEMALAALRRVVAP
ncbi:MAG: HTH-type transcriptional repressor KstR2 [Frankiales bacterium]|nr:HTH-type transcriptional repressor KstR2 [Frankiales bacterium]